MFRDRRAAVATCLFTVLLALMPETARASQLVIEQGQEQILTTMLGGDTETIGGCVLQGVSVDRTIVVATYRCGDGLQRIELRHPSAPGARAAETDKFALVPLPGGQAHPELTEAVSARVRLHESAFHWTSVEPRDGAETRLSRGEARSRGRGHLLDAVVLVISTVCAFLIGFAIAVRAAKRMERRSVCGSITLRRTLWQATALAASAFLLLLALIPPPPVHPDTVREILIASDCLAGFPCGRGSDTSFGVLVNGALWTRFLALLLRLGFGTRGIQYGVLALLAVSGAIVFFVVRRRFSLAYSTITAGAWVLLGAVLTEAPRLWNPSLTPLPLALFSVALIRFVENGGAGFGVAAGGLLGLAIDCHLVLAELSPVLIAAIAACGRTPWRTGLSALALLVAVSFTDSRLAWSLNLRLLTSPAVPVGMAGALAAAAMAGFLARRSLAGAPVEGRVAAFFATAVVLGVCAPFALSGSGWADNHWQARYLIAALPGLAFGSALASTFAARSLGRAYGIAERWPLAAIGIGGIAVACRVLHADTGSLGWSFADAKAVAGPLYSQLHSYRAIRTHVVTESRFLLSAMAIFDPARATARSPTAGGRASDLLLFRAPKAQPAPVGPWIATVDLGTGTALVGTVQPFLDRERVRACYVPLEESRGPGGCVDTSYADVEAGQAAYPELAGARDRFPEQTLLDFGGVHETVAIRLAPFAGPAHSITLLVEPGAQWAIEEVTGVRFHGALPARHVSVDGVSGEGTLVIGRRTPPQQVVRDRYWPPAAAEIPETEAALLDAIDKGLVR